MSSFAIVRDSSEAKMIMMKMQQRMVLPFSAIAVCSPLRRSIYMGTMNRAVVDFVPVRKEKMPFIFKAEGIRDRWFRIVQAARRSVGYVYQLQRRLLRTSNFIYGP